MRTVIILILTLTLFLSCSGDDSKPEEERINYVTVQLDYLGEGGSYTDDIAGVPFGLVLGTNGPYEFDADEKEYHITYRPNSNWETPATLTWYAHKEYNYRIHCYVEYGNQVNYAHIDVNPEWNSNRYADRSKN